MYHYTARIVCDKCKTTYIIEAGSKADLPSMRSMAQAAKERGWEVKEKRCLCEYCKNNAMRPEHYMG